MVLDLIGALIGAKAINDVGKKYSQKANPNLNDKKFDADCAEYGVATSSAGYTQQKIMDIAARCGVRPNKYGVLPENGWKHCLDYIAEYVNHPDDISNFERDWRIVVARQLDDKSAKLIEEKWPYYQTSYNGYLENKEFWTSGPKIVLRFKHWHGLPKDEYLKRLEDIQTKTFWGELVLKPPVLRNNPRFEDSFTETWVMQGCKTDELGRGLTHNAWRTLYKTCMGVCGYDAML